MEKSGICKACGQDLPMLKAGDIIEVLIDFGNPRGAPKGSLGVVANEGLVCAYAEYYGLKDEVIDSSSVWFVSLQTGVMCRRHRDQVQQVHGFIHIERN